MLIAASAPSSGASSDCSVIRSRPPSRRSRSPLTDTADWADIVLPATTQLEHWDVHFSYGHHYVTLNRPSIEPIGECKPNSEIFRLLAERMGIDHPVMRDDDLTLIRQALDTDNEKMQGVTLESLLGRSL